MSVQVSVETQKKVDEAYLKWLYAGKSKNRVDVKERLQRIREDTAKKVKAVKMRAETRKRMRNPMLRRITDNYNIKYKLPTLKSGDLFCSKCGDVDHNNLLNGKSWCFKCNRELTEHGSPPKKASIRKGNLDKVYRKLRGLPNG